MAELSPGRRARPQRPLSAIFGSLPGRLVLAGYTWALLHHMLGGLRHFLWDLGFGYDLKTIDQLSWGSILLSLVSTAVVWACVSLKAGGV